MTVTGQEPRTNAPTRQRGIASKMPQVAIPRGALEAIGRAAADLALVAPFSELAPVDRARLAATLEEVTYATGDVIFAQGARADALYILREGTVERQADG